jgi:hypothetical protein
MRWVGHVAHMEDMRNTNKVSAGNPEGKRPSENPSIGGRKIPELIFKE